MKLYYFNEKINFKRPFKIAHGVRSSTSIVLLEIHFENFIGYGEASLPPYLIETQESVISFLEKVKYILKPIQNFNDLDSIVEEMKRIEKGNTAAKAAVEMALFDLLGKLENKTSRAILINTSSDKPILTSYTLGIDSKEVLEQKIIEGEMYKMFKVKLNGENDEEIIAFLRSKTDKPLIIDVNQGWKNKKEALKKIEWLASQNVLMIEQPLLKEKIDDYSWLYDKSPLPIFADESIQDLNDLLKYKDCFHGINIKLMKCGGMIEAKKMIEKARAFNLKILLGCMTETSCAISAAAQISSLVDYNDLDSPQLISNDFFSGINFDKGKLYLSNAAGLGVERV